MLFSSLFTALVSLTAFSSVSASPIDTERSLVKKDFGPNTIFTPPSTYSNERTLYGRSVLLNDVSGSRT